MFVMFSILSSIKFTVLIENLVVTSDLSVESRIVGYLKALAELYVRILQYVSVNFSPDYR